MQIESRIPIHPKAKVGAPPGPICRALKQMGVGQSFWVADYTEAKATNLHTQAKRAGRKIVTRKTVKDGEPGIRVWVTEILGELVA